METNRLLRALSESLAELHKFVRAEQAKDLKRNLLSPAADAHMAVLTEKGLARASELDAVASLPQTSTESESAGASFKLTLNVTYSLNGVAPTEMANNLRKMCEKAIGDGMLTGSTDAEVAEYAMDVEAVAEAVLQPS